LAFHRVARGREQADYTRPQVEQFPAGERSGEVAGQVDDEEACEWRHDRAEGISGSGCA
jgi:hypothetical protein